MTDTDKDMGGGVDPALGQALAALTPGTLDDAAGTGPWRHKDKTWKDGEAGGTPITAADLNQMGAELSALFAATPQYTVAGRDDPVPSTPCMVRVIDHTGAYQGTWYDGGAGRVQVGMDPALLSPKRRVVEWLSDWTGDVVWSAGQSKPEFKDTLQVSSPPSVGGRWYLIEIGSRVDVSRGEYGMRCTIEDKQHGVVFNGGLISPRGQGGVDDFNFSRSAWIPNGLYDVTLNLCRWGEVTIGGDRAWAYTDWSPGRGATTCYRYFHITQMS